MFSLIIAACFFATYLWFRRRDARLLRNGVLIVGAGFFGAIGIIEVLTAIFPPFGILLLIVLALIPVAVVVLAVFLIANGITMWQIEGRSLGNLLSLLAGIGIILLPFVAFGLFQLGPVGIGLLALLAFAVTYSSVVFVVFWVYSIVYSRMRDRIVPEAVFVLGAGLIHGRVPPLLRSRLDKGYVVYRTARAAGASPILIPTGGQGDDEPRSEGEAMAEYLLEKGADPADVFPEMQARNTRENFERSLEIQEAAGRPGPALAVTNDYHVLRSALLARSVGVDAQVIGSPTAAYFVPSAFLREFVAIVVEHKVLHAVLALPFVAATVYGVVLLYQAR